MPIACKYCIATKGLKGSEINGLPQNEEEFMQHVEREHHIPVQRKNETEEQCLARFRQENPGVGGPRCLCPECRNKRGG